ncbi:metallopeptidase TldD-related protein [Streptomyces radicis]|uniref:TldD/PmbA family protein n=1 Tax=Streptomyces radicis TaxID=1750517 RepID=A0A3A9VT13_9ACTN|nr:metallopeptidase TldD-related protein [Streptomyces radicis]RKN03919.1 TldD/PmbA family protein [Streptomyces radicis]RKN14141.1 TldD/PmbA family protein [Streptomyces radicis]
MSSGRRGADAPHEIVERALELSRADGAVVIVEETSTAHLRWAANALTTNGVTRGRRVTVIATVNGAEGTAAGVVGGTAVGADALEPLVRAAEEAARQSPSAEDARALLGGAPAGDFTAAPDATSAAAFDAFAPALGETFARARAEGRELFGFANDEVVSTYLGTSAGLRRRHDQHTGHVELNAKSPDRRRSAFVTAPTDDFAAVDPAALDADLATRLRWAERRIDLPAGRYETLLPPTAVADLITYLYWNAGARDAHEGRTVFSGRGGGTRVGERLSPLPLTLSSDPGAPGVAATPFVVAHSSTDTFVPAPSVFDNGLPIGRTEWISDGVLRRLLTTRHTAELTGLPVAPLTDNLLLDAGGTRPLSDLVADTGRGLLVSTLWYIREVDPKTLLLTGLTRDGVYLVEGGEVVGVVNNFRFNESPVDLLSRAVEASRAELCRSREWGEYFPRTSMPTLRVPEFNMSSVSPGV